MAFLIRCDRCATEAVLENVPKAGTVSMFPPAGWYELRGKQLCERCNEGVNEFIKPLPQAAKS